MAQQKRLTRAQKITLGKFTTNWSLCRNVPVIDMAELFARGLIECDVTAPGSAPNGKYRLTETGLSAQQKG